MMPVQNAEPAGETTISAGRRWWDGLSREERDAVLLIADGVLGRRASAYEAYLIYLDLFGSGAMVSSEA